MRQRRSPSPRSPGSGRILGAVGIAMIAIAVLGVVFVLVNRPEAATTAAPPAQAGPPPATHLGRVPASQAETPIENEHSHVPDDEPTEDETSRPKQSPSRSPKPTRPPSPTEPAQEARPAITEGNLPAATDLAWRATGDWQERAAAEESGDELPSVCLPSVTVLANPAHLFRRDYTLAASGHGTALIADYASDAEAEEVYAELGRSIRDCPRMLRRQGYLQPSPVAARPVPLPEGVVAEHLRLEYQERQSRPTTESIGLVRAGNRLLMVSMVTPAADTSWAKDPAGQAQDHPMMRTLPVAAGRLIA
ncbi:hypothetical protein [Microlunatus speluncae]|uniref:hypothetical protein n=1 Tax=Microlunatus speluncae TaxID=2594267 RepID=UPI001375B654|nr:hypothetical protein [Microlunatus speluncae]